MASLMEVRDMLALQGRMEAKQLSARLQTPQPMDARRDLSKKADELGGKYFVVIAGQKNEKTVHANADVYK